MDVKDVARAQVRHFKVSATSGSFSSRNFCRRKKQHHKLTSLKFNFMSFLITYLLIYVASKLLQGFGVMAMHQQIVTQVFCSVWSTTTLVLKEFPYKIKRDSKLFLA